MSTPGFYDLALTTLTYGGDCMGRLPDGRVVFIPCTLPGERVRVRLVEEKRSHARAELVEVLTPSPDRVVPRCPHFFSPLSREAGEGVGVRACGGCHYQHMTYEAQLAAKTTILRDQLERIGGLQDPPVQPCVPSLLPSPPGRGAGGEGIRVWSYRNYIQFHLSSRGELGMVGAGLEASRRERSEAIHKSAPTNIVPIRECHLPEAILNAVWPQLDFEPIPGLERVSLRLGVDDDVMLILESRDPQPPEFTVEELPISAVHLSPEGPLVLAGSGAVHMEILGRAFRVSAGSFFQVNTPMAATMVEHLLARLPITSNATVLDVYCGVGLFSAFLAARVGRLVGIEISPSACQDYEVNLDEFDNVELYEAAAEAVLPALDLQPDVIVVDPPRAGLGSPTLNGILRLNAPILAYISCDPATLSRDARRLVEGGYHLTQITPFDLFPQTYHIESISFWEK